jgi:hypothetical protein
MAVGLLGRSPHSIAGRCKGVGRVETAGATIFVAETLITGFTVLSCFPAVRV